MKIATQFWKKSLIGLVLMLSAPAAIGASPVRESLADGIYLFGQSPKPQEIGQEYLIFRVRQGKMTGAIFAPGSEFSCFTGTIEARQVNLSIVDPYEGEVYRHSIALKPLDPVASDRAIVQKTNLEGYYAIETINESDRQLLQTCLKKLPD